MKLRLIIFTIAVVAALSGCTNGGNTNGSGPIAHPTTSGPVQPKIDPNMPTVESNVSDVDSVVREAAWNNLSEAEKNELVGDWKTAKVEEAKQSELPTPSGIEIPEKPDHPYKVTFKTNRDELLGPIVILVDGDTKEIIARVMRK